MKYLIVLLILFSIVYISLFLFYKKKYTFVNERFEIDNTQCIDEETKKNIRRK